MSVIYLVPKSSQIKNAAAARSTSETDYPKALTGNFEEARFRFGRLFDVSFSFTDDGSAADRAAVAVLTNDRYGRGVEKPVWLTSTEE